MDYPLPNNSSDLSGQTALVTGASAGLGVRFAQVLAACGAKVAVTGRRKDRLDSVVEDIRKRGGTAEAFVFDVGEVESVATVVAEVEARLGLVSILVNNAGIPDAQHSTKMSIELISRVLDVNLKGPYVLSCEVARRLIAAKQPGRIINLSSIGSFSYRGSGASLYSTSKAAVTRMTEALALEWAKFNINVNAIAPGTFNSEMTGGMIERTGDAFIDSFPRKRLGDAPQLDSTLIYLASPASEFVTGSIIKVDDAQVAR